MAKSKGLQELIVWQKAHHLVLNIYQLTRSFPKEELFGITSQIRRSTVSVAANITEGYRKRTKPDKIKFMNIAQGSLDETHYYQILIQDLAYADTINVQHQLDEVAKLLNAYTKAIEDSK